MRGIFKAFRSKKKMWRNVCVWVCGRNRNGIKRKLEQTKNVWAWHPCDTFFFIAFHRFAIILKTSITGVCVGVWIAFSTDIIFIIIKSFHPIQWKMEYYCCCCGIRLSGWPEYTPYAQTDTHDAHSDRIDCDAIPFIKCIHLFRSLCAKKKHVTVKRTHSHPRTESYTIKQRWIRARTMPSARLRLHK